MTALERLERIAARVGWKLVWNSEPCVHRPALIYRTLDVISKKRRPVLLSGPLWNLAPIAQEAASSERLAAVLLDALPKPGGAATT